MSCTTPQSRPHTEESPSAPWNWSDLSGFRGSAEEPPSGKRDTRENEGQKGRETGAVSCVDNCWGG